MQMFCLVALATTRAAARNCTVPYSQTQWWNQMQAVPSLCLQVRSTSSLPPSHSVVLGQGLPSAHPSGRRWGSSGPGASWVGAGSGGSAAPGQCPAPPCGPGRPRPARRGCGAAHGTGRHLRFVIRGQVVRVPQSGESVQDASSDGNSGADCSNGASFQDASSEGRMLPKGCRAWHAAGLTASSRSGMTES